MFLPVAFAPPIPLPACPPVPLFVDATKDMRGLGYLASGLAAGPPKKDASRDASPFVAAAQPASPSSASGGGGCAASAGHARAVGRLLDAVGRRVAVADAAGLELLRENGAVSAALRGGCAGVYALEETSTDAVADNVRTLRMLGELADDGEGVAAALAFVVSDTKRDTVLECRDFAADVCRRAGSGIGGGRSPEGCPVLVVVGVGDAACGTVQGFEVVHAPVPCTVLPHMFHLNVEGAVPFDSRPFVCCLPRTPTHAMHPMCCNRKDTHTHTSTGAAVQLCRHCDALSRSV